MILRTLRWARLGWLRWRLDRVETALAGCEAMIAALPNTYQRDRQLRDVRPRLVRRQALLRHRLGLSSLPEANVLSLKCVGGGT